MSMGSGLWNSFRIRTIFGFHGNSEITIDRAMRDGYRRSARKGDWLGSGLYFWLDAPARAWDWADKLVTRTSSQHPGPPSDTAMVLLAELQFNDHWIDLIEVGPWITRFRMAAQKFERLGVLPQQTPDIAASALHERDCAFIEAAINAAALNGIRVDAIRCAFLEGTPVAVDSAIYDRAHVQIAVRNPSVILRTSKVGR